MPNTLLSIIFLSVCSFCPVSRAEPNIAEPNLTASKSVIIQDSDAVRVAKAELRAEFYEKALECYRTELENYKWIINFSLKLLTALIAIGGIVVTLISKSLSTKAVKKDRGIVELWAEASIFYSSEEYEKAAEIWQKLYKKYNVKSRQLFNNWGSSLLNWARPKKDPQWKALLEKAAEKYKKAEAYTRGIAAYNLARIYGNGLLDDEEECKKWLKVGEETGRLLTRERAMKEEDFGDFRNKDWFEQICWKGE